MVMRQTADHVDASFKAVCSTTENHVNTSCTLCHHVCEVSVPRWLDEYPSTKWKRSVPSGCNRKNAVVTRKTTKCISRRFLFWKLRSHLSPPQTPPGGGVLNNFTRKTTKCISRRFLFWKLRSQLSPPQTRGGGGTQQFYPGRPRPEVQPLTLLYTTFDRKGSPFVYLVYWQMVPLWHTYCSLELSIPFKRGAKLKLL